MAILIKLLSKMQIKNAKPKDKDCKLFIKLITKRDIIDIGEKLQKQNKFDIRKKVLTLVN